MVRGAGAKLPKQASWVPETPTKPVPPRTEPICADMQEHQQGPEECSDSEDFPPGFAPEAARAGGVSSRGSTGGVEMNPGPNNSEALLSGGGRTSWQGTAVPTTPAATTGPFMSLLALADAAVTGRSEKDLAGATGGALSCFLDSIYEDDWFSSYPPNSSTSGSAPALPQFSSITANHSAQNLYGLPDHPTHGCDVDLAPAPRAEADPNEAIPQFAPITPGKAHGLQSRLVPEGRYFGGKDGTSQEQHSGDSNVARKLVLEEAKHDKELVKAVVEAPSADVSTLPEEDNKIEKVDDQGMSMSRTPQQKPRRKKHRPKVVSEGKPRRTPAPRTPTSTGTEGETRVKRKYIRKKGVEKPQPALPMEVTEDSGEQNRDEPSKKSRRRALNFDTEGQQVQEIVAGQSSTCVAESKAQDIQTQREQQNADGQLPQLFEVKVGDAPEGLARELNKSMNYMPREDMLVQESYDPSKTPPAKTSFLQGKLGVHCSATSVPGGNKLITHRAPENVDVQTSTSQSNPECEQPIESERCHDHGQQIPSGYMNLFGVQFNSLQAYESIPELHFPKIYKKKRTEKGQVPTSGASSSTDGKLVTGPGITSGVDAERIDTVSSKAGHAATLHENGTQSQDKQQPAGYVLPFFQTERSAKKRSRGLTRVRDSASLSKLTEFWMLPTYPPQQSANGHNSQNNHLSMQALLMQMDPKLSRKKRTKRLPMVNSAYPWALAPQLSRSDLIHQNRHMALAHTPGHQPQLPQIHWKQYNTVDAITEQLRYLDINRESSTSAHQDQNALIPYGIGHQAHQKMLVLYRTDGTVVPFEGPFNPQKRKRPRPKVDLDDETTRVWKLLLEDINSQGIDGTGEEKARWWEEERRVFKGRTDSFIARMHLVQGDRRFSPWKGSVVDSVVGVFLTQNVSDHLSSSAFMSLASQFPANLRPNHCFEEGTSSVINEPEACTLDLEYTSKWREKMSSPAVWDRSSVTVNETENSDEIEVVNSEESSTSVAGRIRSLDELTCHFSNSNSSRNVMEIQSHSAVHKSTADIAESIGIGADRRAEIDGLSSRGSPASSQNSLVVLKAGSDESKELTSDNSETDDQRSRSKLSEPSSADAPASYMQLLTMAGSKLQHGVNTHEIGGMSSNANSSDILAESRNTDQGGERQNTNTSNATKSTMLQDECSQDLREEGKTSESCKVDSGSSTIDGVTAINQAITEDKITLAIDQIPRNSVERNQISSSSTISKNRTDEHAERSINVPSIRKDDRTVEDTCLSRLFYEDQQNGSSMNHPKGSNQESAEKCLSKQVHPAAEESNEMNIRASKSKSSAAGKDKKAEFDWDSLRKQAESCGSKRTRSPNTMDSVDWEAIRCADVNEIAEAIKDRGMNNVLAGRIQDFLNRIVREHGSIDLEWLRDVPPDKAKEYLLSFKGLGLKSVECVRLLTLHHLAFPVDTNVGRIAVRLGWVPLQPLPESLQLHLLELYPVLESIQKYLWPRLCKLDQRTLYELHYQMITFGKVFCTKSRPNCNACPMRGECRHFASAFASARLALPGPEQKSIVGSSKTVVSSQNHSEPLQLPSSLEAEKSEQQQLARQRASNSQPIIEEPASPEPECTQIVENDGNEIDLEDFNEIPTIRLNIEEFTQNLQNYMQHNMELQEGDMSKALVALTPEAASIPAPKLKNVSRLRTEHLVYEIPDGHPLLNGLDKLEPDDPSKYLLAIWTPGETADSIEPPQQKCNSPELGIPCNDGTCFSCHCLREANSQTVRGTILIPCRTAMRGSFPLNGTYFQVNEVFADHESSLHPIDVPRDWLWKLHRRTVYFGTSIPAIFKGLSTEGIQHCFWRGFVCVRGFDRETRAPRPLMARLHFPASKLSRTRGKTEGVS